jgi:molybdopterin converting factor small subunit
MGTSTKESKQADVKILLKYLVSLRDRIGRREEEVSFPAGSVLKDVADWLEKEYALRLPDQKIMAILNGKGWNQFPRKLLTEIKNGDKICLLPPISGG